MRHAERSEGTAHYVETETMSASKLWTKMDVLGRYRDLLRDDSSIPGNFGTWYATGGAQCIALERLDPSGLWQKEIEAGASPEDVLKRLIH